MAKDPNRLDDEKDRKTRTPTINPELGKVREVVKELKDKFAAEWEKEWNDKEPMTRGRARVEGFTINMLAGGALMLVAWWFSAR